MEALGEALLDDVVVAVERRSLNPTRERGTPTCPARCPSLTRRVVICNDELRDGSLGRGIVG